MASFAPTAEELAAFSDVGAVAAWLEMEDEVLEAVKKAAGARTLSLRTWARIPAARWASMLLSVKVPDPESDDNERPLSPVEEGQAGELREILNQIAQLGPSPATGGGPGPGHGEVGAHDPRLPGGGPAAGAGAAAEDDHGGRAGTDALVPGGTGGTQLAPGIAGRKGTDPIRGARLGPAGTEACARGSEEVLQRTASQSGSRWLRVLGRT